MHAKVAAVLHRGPQIPSTCQEALTSPAITFCDSVLHCRIPNNPVTTAERKPREHPPHHPPPPFFNTHMKLTSSATTLILPSAHQTRKSTQLGGRDELQRGLPAHTALSFTQMLSLHDTQANPPDVMLEMCSCRTGLRSPLKEKGLGMFGFLRQL